MVTTNDAPSGIGTEGVITSFVAGHCSPFCDAPFTVGEHAGGFGFVALTGVVVPTACANGSGSACPLGSPGYVGCTEVKVAGCPLTLNPPTTMIAPAAAFIDVRSKSTLRSVRHCVARSV